MKPQAILLAFLTAMLAYAELPLGFALQRDAYQTNETIPIHVYRQTAPLSAGDLTLTLAGEDGSEASFTFTAPASAVPRSEHLNLDARLLRPGAYTVTISVDGDVGSLTFTVASHLRKSSFRVVSWGTSAKGDQNLVQGEDSLGYNLVMQNQGRTSTPTTQQIRGGVDWTSCCVMSGGHQMDLRVECDWSDPYVVAEGGTRRVLQDVFRNRTAGNAIGSHFYDEPGLTWGKDPVTGKFTPHNIAPQVRAYEAAFGEKPIHFSEVDPANPDDVRRWTQWATWKLSFMSAAWKDAAFAANLVRPDYISFTQSQYGFSAFTDGYYFNVVHSLPLVSGHGGYHDWGPGYWHPSWTLDIARARDRAKPNWYMPLWYSNSTSEHTRLEQYLSFATGIQGLMTPPPMDPAARPFGLSFDGVVESNKLMLKLGPIFTTMDERIEPVAILFSLSDMVHEQATVNMEAYYSHQTKHGNGLHIPYLAGKLNQRTFQYIVDEDIVDGTLAQRHKAVILPAIDYLAPEVMAGLQAFMADGGKVLLSQESELKLPGSIIIPAQQILAEADLKKADEAQARFKEIMSKTGPLNAANTELGKEMNALRKEKSDEAKAKLAELQAQAQANRDQIEAIRVEAEPFDAVFRSLSASSMRGSLVLATTYSKALEPILQKLGIPADASSSEPGISVQRQGAGEVDYFFVINATHDYNGNPQLALAVAETDLALPATGEALYDAIHALPATKLTRQGNTWAGHLRFGEGQMRVYAQTARPIGSVQVMTPLLHRDSTVAGAPITLELTASVLAADGVVLDGSIPVRLRLIDPLGNERYEFFRATTQGTIRQTLPLAANDPAGAYQLTVEELLSGKTGQATFTYTPTSRNGMLAGPTRRAIVFGRDGENIFRFFRLHQDITLVLGNNDAYQAVADRLSTYLKPWAVRTTIFTADSVNRGKLITDDMRPTVVGLAYGGKGWTREDERSTNLGYDVNGPVILIGTPEDNPLIKGIDSFLPVTPSAKDVPGAGRGLLAYQRGAIGARQDSITLIAYDQAGLDEAAGHLYEIMAGLEPLTPWTMAGTQHLSPAATATAAPPLSVAWRAIVTDKADALLLDGQDTDGRDIVALTHDGSREVITANGQLKSHQVIGLDAVAKQAAPLQVNPAKLDKTLSARAGIPNRLLRNVILNGDIAAALYVGGLVRLLDTEGKVLAEHQFDDDVLHALWLGNQLIVSTSAAEVVALTQP